MIDKKSRRVVIINNICSETIDQAIFILKSDKTDILSAKTDVNIANEAQSIINNYIKQVERLKTSAPRNRQKKGKKRKLPAWLSFLITLALLTTVCYMFGQSL